MAHVRQVRATSKCAHFRVIEGNVGALLEGNPEQLRCRVERRLDHAVERKVRLDFGFIHIELGGAHFLGVIAPIPRLDFDVGTFAGSHRLQFLKLVAGALHGRRPHAIKQLTHACGRLRHALVERVVGIGLVA